MFFYHQYYGIQIFFIQGDFISVRWYSVLFILGFVIGRFLVVGAYKREKGMIQQLICRCYIWFWNFDWIKIRPCYFL